jgi:Flp pilus assembly protein TadD
MGTLGYMSPEQLRGEAVDYRTDFFAFGAILYEMLCGQPAFKKPNAADTISAILNTEPLGISQLLPNTPPALSRVVHRCLEKNSEQRFQSASDLAFALEALSDSGLVAVAEAPTIASGKLKEFAFSVAAVLILLLASGLIYRYHRNRGLTEKETTVVADFMNTTGDSVFDDTLKTALVVSLRQSPFLNVLPESKLVASLRLMDRPATTSITPVIAREVCLRVGSRAYISGAIASLGSEYVLGLKAVDCQSGDVLAEVQATAPTKEKVLDVLGKAASKLRAQLGESLATVQNFDVPLVEATTFSLEALKAYSLGGKALGEKGPADGLHYFKRAIELDPNFAIGYSALGDDYNSLGEVGRAREYYGKAFELRDHTSEREKLTITANYYSNVTGELDKANQAYQELIESYPRDSRPYNELGNVFTAQGQYEKATDAYLHSKLLDPYSSVAYANLGNSNMGLQRYEETRQAVREAQARKLDD